MTLGGRRHSPLALPAAPASRVRQSPWYGGVDALDRLDIGRRAVLAGSPEAVPGESPMRWSTTNPGAADPLPTPPPLCTPSVEAAAVDDRSEGKQEDADRRAEEEWESDGGAMGPSPEAAHEP